MFTYILNIRNFPQNVVCTLLYKLVNTPKSTFYRPKTLSYYEKYFDFQITNNIDNKRNKLKLSGALDPPRPF